MSDSESLKRQFLKTVETFGFRDGAQIARAGVGAKVSSTARSTSLVDVLAAARSVATAGARPSTLSIQGHSDQVSEACEALSIDVVEGSTNLVTGSVDSADLITETDFVDDGDLIYLVGARPNPIVDFVHERKLNEIMVAASRDGLLNAALDIGDGGLAIAISSMAVPQTKGARFWTPDDFARDALLFENLGGVLAVVPRSEELRFSDMCIARYMPLYRIGVVDGDQLELQGEFMIAVNELRV